MKLVDLITDAPVISEVVESETSWLNDSFGVHADTNEVIKVTQLADTTVDRLHKDPIAIVDGKEIYIPNFIKEYDARKMGKIYRVLQKIIKSKGWFVAGVRKGLRVGNDAIPYGSADDKMKAKYGPASEKFGIRILVTVDGKSLSDIIRFMDVEDVLGSKPGGPERPIGAPGDDEGKPEDEGAVPEYVLLLWGKLDELVKAGTVYIERAAAPMFEGYAAIYSKANPNRIMLFHKAIGRGFYVIPDQIAMWVYPDRRQMMPWKEAMAAFKANPAKYLGSLIKPGGLLHQAKDAHPQLYNQIAEIVDAMGSEDIEHPLAGKPRHLFRFYMLGSGQLAGEYPGGEARTFSRKDREKLANDIVMWAGGQEGAKVESIEWLKPTLIESICDRHECVILPDEEISMINETSVYDFNKPHERLYGDLTPNEQAILKAIRSPDDIKSVEVIDDWMDDHIMCVGVKLNGVSIGFWWVGFNIGAFEYAEGPRAKAKIFELLRSEIEDTEAEYLELKGGGPVGEAKKVQSEAAPIGLPWRDRNVGSPSDVSPEPAMAGDDVNPADYHGNWAVCDSCGREDWIPEGESSGYVEGQCPDCAQKILSRGMDANATVELIGRFARAAFEYRTSGEIERAMEYERKVTQLIDKARAAGFGDEAEAAETEAQLP